VSHFFGLIGNIWNLEESAMPAKKPFVNIKHLPDDLFSYQDERFYDFVDKFIGKKNKQDY
jgi:hypothetical protein